MLLVDSQRRASLEEVAAHQWLQEGGQDDVIVPLPDLDDIPKQDLEVILHRMEQGGYGTMDSILKYVLCIP